MRREREERVFWTPTKKNSCSSFRVLNFFLGPEKKFIPVINRENYGCFH